MREIKFRAWDKKEKVMHGVLDLHFYPDGITSFETQNFVDSYELMQYTGLKDKNGKEIYEGDLYYFSRYSALPAEVYWDDRWAGWRGRVKGEMQFDKTYDISPIKFGEVIGNIYENEDLLK